MKAYQKTQLQKFFLLLGKQKNEKMLIVTCPGKRASLVESNRERDFLVEARAYFADGAEIETWPVDELAYLRDDKIYDLILLRYVLFHQVKFPMDEKKSLKILARHLSPWGRIVVLENNRMGLKTLAGDRYDGTGKERGLLKSELRSATPRCPAVQAKT